MDKKVEHNMSYYSENYANWRESNQRQETLIIFNHV